MELQNLTSEQLDLENLEFDLQNLSSEELNFQNLPSEVFDLQNTSIEEFDLQNIEISACEEMDLQNSTFDLDKYLVFNPAPADKQNEIQMNSEVLESSDEDKEDLISKLSIYTQLPDGTYSCDICSFKDIKAVVDDKTLMFRHLLRGHSHSHKFECAECSGTFKEETSLTKHIDLTHQDCQDKADYLACEKCDHKSKNDLLMKLHVLRKHAAAYKYVCKCCTRCFKTVRAKKKHERIVERAQRMAEKLNYMCDECGEISKTKDELARHLQDVHCDVLDFSRNVSTLFFNTIMNL